MVNNRLNLTILFYLISCVTGLLIPEAKVETMSPRGFRISIPGKFKVIYIKFDSLFHIGGETCRQNYDKVVQNSIGQEFEAKLCG